MLPFSRVALLQFRVRLGEPAANLERVRALFADLAPAAGTLVLLPELWSCGFDAGRMARHAAATPALLDALRGLAAASGAWFAGSLPEPSGNGGLPRNTFFLTGPDGVAGRYRKQHLFAFWKEDRLLAPGDRPRAIATAAGLLGALVCYDLRFPELAREQAFAGCGLLAVSAQWPMVRLDHWQALLTARAIENQVFVAACNSCGRTGHTEMAGHSMVVAPDGSRLLTLGSDAGSGQCFLDGSLLATLRSRFCSVGERPWPWHDRDKVISLERLLPRLAAIRRQGSRVAFTNGCFDILHAGHVSYLEQARRCGDCLVVGLNSDRSVRALKGDSRPVNGEQERARVLAALGCVDFVVIFDDETPIDLIRALGPDVLVKGADWPEDRIVGAAEVKAAGGRVERIAFEHQVSTSAVIESIRGQGD
ncbi:MAG TPA: D-glycero-beta-D-manno-heptose 1-phosphate adenylyltransferase [Desulfobulbus sp.]|nr:D-glycero-beta-D-manno-heptose 1-phosphate adenylyltransferase [Desulfobulbus sp.]